VHGHRNGQDHGGLPDLLEALERPLEPAGRHRKPRILFLADRNVLVDDPKDKTFTPVGHAGLRIDAPVLAAMRELAPSTFSSTLHRCEYSMTVSPVLHSQALETQGPWLHHPMQRGFRYRDLSIW